MLGLELIRLTKRAAWYSIDKYPIELNLMFTKVQSAFDSEFKSTRNHCSILCNKNNKKRKEEKQKVHMKFDSL